MSHYLSELKTKLHELEDGIERIDVLNEYSWKLSRLKTYDAHVQAIQALDMAREFDYAKGEAKALRTVAQCYWLQGDYTATLINCDLSYTIFKNLNDQKGEAEILNLYGGVYSDMGDLPNSKLNFEKALLIRQLIGDQLGIVKSMNSIGDLLMRENKHDEALALFEKCLAIQHDSPMYRGIISYNVAEANFYLENYAAATKQILDCQQLGIELDFDLMAIYSSSLLGQINFAQNDLKSAIAHQEKALKLSRSIEAKDRVYNCLKELSLYYETSGDMGTALALYKEYQQVKEEVINKESSQRIKNLQHQHEIEAVKQETETVRIKNDELRQAFSEIEWQRNEIEQQNNEIRASIKYAQRIQAAIMPSDELMKKSLPESFVFYQPKETLSGDFYWVSEVVNDKEENLIVVAVADCTGHGVPGALMSIVGNNFLRICENEATVNNAGQALEFINAGVCKTLRQKPDESIIKDGMDIAFLAIDYPNMKFYFAGAKNPVYIIRNEELIVIKGDKHPIGAYLGEELKPFTNHSVSMIEGDQLYLFSDGYSDQFGGKLQKKLKTRNFKKLLLDNSHLSMTEQKNKLMQFFQNWKGSLEQIDDVCVMGIRI